MRRDLFTEDHEAFRQLASDFIEKEVVPHYPEPGTGSDLAGSGPRVRDGWARRSMTFITGDIQADRCSAARASTDPEYRLPRPNVVAVEDACPASPVVASSRWAAGAAPS